MKNKKIIFAGFVFAVFFAVALSANSANAGFWDWFKDGSDNTAAVAKAAKIALGVEKNGKGTVTSDDGKINCGRDCKEVYYSGGSVVLTATPAEGFIFDKWTGNTCLDKGYEYKDVTIGHCTVSLKGKSKNLTAKAHFKKISEGSGGGGGGGATTGTATDAPSPKSRKGDSSSSILKDNESANNTTPTIKVVSPNGGEVWKAGTKKNIVFKGNLIKEKVYLNLEWGGSGGGNVFIGESITSGNSKNSTYSWTIPATTEQRNDYKISARYPNFVPNDTVPAVIIDSSDKTFTIKSNFSPFSSKSSKSSSSRSSKSSSSSKSSATSTYTYTLKINKSGKGYVSVEDNRIACGTDCEGEYKDGDTVKLRAVPDGGYVFDRFSPGKECSSVYSGGFGLNDNKLTKQAFAYGPAENVVCVTTMNKNKTITAVFKKISWKKF